MSDFKTPLDILEFPRATMYTPAPGVDNERSSLGWSTLNGNPRVTVWTRVDDKEKGPIQAGIGHEYIEGMLTAAEDLFRSDIVDTIAFDNKKNMPNEEGGRAEMVTNSVFMVGRDEEGICFFSLTSNDDSRPKIIFPFLGFHWHKPRRKSTPFTPAELSRIHAVSMVSYLRKCFDLTVKGQTPEERKAEAERRKGQRESKGGYNRTYSGGAKPAARPATAAMANFTEDDFGF